MIYQFEKHYTREEARALLPDIRRWLAGINVLRRSLDQSERRWRSLVAKGRDVGGPVVNQWVRTLAELHAILDEFQRREIQIKDLDRGLIDFPALRSGKEVFLCWEDGEEDVEFWHDLDAGYAGREKL